MNTHQDRQQDLQDRLNALNGFLSKSIRDLEDKEKMPGLEMMEKEVETLCGDIEKSRPEIARAMTPAMEEIIQKLDMLAEQINTLKEKESS